MTKIVSASHRESNAEDIGATGSFKRLLVVSSAWPHVTQPLEAANVIAHCILSGLARTPGFQIAFAYVNIRSTTVPDAARSDLDSLRAAGVEFLEPVLVPDASQFRKSPLWLLKVLWGNFAGVLSGCSSGSYLQRSIGGRRFDAVLTVWTEVGANVASELSLRRFAYHGNPDHKVFDAQYEIQRLLGAERRGLLGIADKAKRAILRRLVERAHLSVMRRYDFVADVAANDSGYYAANGVNAFYINNMWPAEPPVDWEARRDQLEAQHPGKIVGNVGNLSATGNSLGIIALVQELLPAFKRRLPDSFEIHIFGGGMPKPSIEPLLNDPHIKRRGFVRDLDAEILSAPVFLIANNHHCFKVGHTRFLHAWSLGACVVAFDDCREAMPQIEHGKNALLGRNAEEIAELLAQALSDRDLRRKIGRGGIDTLQKHFRPAQVCRFLLERLCGALTQGAVAS